MKRITLIMLLAISAPALAQEKMNLSLEQAVEAGIEHNPELRNALLEIRASKYQVNEILSTGLPQITGSASFTHNTDIATSVLPDFITPSVYGVLLKENVLDPSVGIPPPTSAEVKFGIPYNLQAGVNLRQLVFDGTFFLGIKAASEFVRIRELTASLSEIDVRQGITQAYYMAQISRANLEQMQNSLQHLVKLKEETEALYNEGFVEKLDVDRLVLSVSNMEIQINNLSKQADLTTKLLLNSMGLDLNTEVTLTSPMPEFNEENFDLAYGLAMGAENRVEFQVMEQQQVLNELDLQRYRVGYVPNLYLNANYGYNTFAGEDQFSDLGKDWFPLSSYGLTLSVPIFDGLYKKSKSDQVRVKILQTENDMRAMRSGIELEINQARIEYVNAYSNLEHQQKNVELAEAIYNSTSIKFKEGVGSSFEMVQAETDLNSARTAYLNALYQLNISKLNLQKALGQI